MRLARAALRSLPARRYLVPSTWYPANARLAWFRCCLPSCRLEQPISDYAPSLLSREVFYRLSLFFYGHGRYWRRGNDLFTLYWESYDEVHKALAREKQLKGWARQENRLVGTPQSAVERLGRRVVPVDGDG